MFQQDDKKKKKTQYKTTYTNPFEAFEDLGKGFSDQAKTHVTEGAKTAINQLIFGAEKPQQKPSGGDLQPGQVLDLKAQQQQQEQQKQIEKQAKNIEPGINYVREILHGSENAAIKNNEELKKDIQNLILEIKSLAGATKSLEKQVSETTSVQIVNPGVYHKNFFRFVISVIRDAKQQVDSAGTWLSAMKGKQKKGAPGAKPKKGANYWDLAEQTGTTQFMLSGERSVSNQTG